MSLGKGAASVEMITILSFSVLRAKTCSPIKEGCGLKPAQKYDYWNEFPKISVAAVSYNLNIGFPCHWAMCRMRG
jgi:hypothetical protein